MITVLEAGSLRSGCQHGQVRTPFLVKDFSLYPHIVEGERELSWASSIRALIPFMRVPPSGPNHLPKAPATNNHHIWYKTSTYEFGEDPNIQIIAKPNPKSFSIYCGEWTVLVIKFPNPIVIVLPSVIKNNTII